MPATPKGAPHRPSVVPPNPPNKPPNAKPRTKMTIDDQAAAMADPIEWMLCVPTDEGHRYEAFDALPSDVQASVSSQFEESFFVHPSIASTSDTERKHHYKYTTFVRVANRRKRAESLYCIKQFIFNSGKEDPCQDNVVYRRCLTTRCPCVRMVEHEPSKFKLFLSVQEVGWRD
jgi:hypothetical protein